MPLVTRHLVDDGVYEVCALGLVLGVVRYDPDAWSCGRWFIDGGRIHTTPYSQGSRIIKRVGCRTLAGAVEEIAVMGSGQIIGEICKRNVP